MNKAPTPAAPEAVSRSRSGRTDIRLLHQTIPVYASRRVSDALHELTATMTIYSGVRLSQILDAVYQQGRKDGAREVFDCVEVVKTKIKHRNPGQPRKKKR